MKSRLWGLVKVLKQGYSLQVTIPKGIADELEIQAGDRLKVEYSKRDRRVSYSVE